MRRPIRYALVALSLANLCFLSPWLVLLNPAHYTYYNWPADPGFVEFKALAIGILILGLLFWLAAMVAHRIRSKAITGLAYASLLLTLILPINSFINDYVRIRPFGLLLGRRWVLIPGLAFAAGLLLICWRYDRQVSRVVITFLIILSPLVLINLASGLWLRAKYVSPPESFREQHAATTMPSRPNNLHIIWIIFDELDQRTAFANRPAGVRLPEFDRFHGEALSSANAYPPSYATLFSMPALTVGQLITDSRPSASNDAALTLTDGKEVDWRNQSNVFSQARTEGFSTGLAGWYHPYCRVIGSSLDWCSWVPVIDEVNPALEKLSLSHALWISLRTAIFRVPFAFRALESQYERQRKQEHQEEFARVSRSAQILLQRNLNLSLLHFPIPHHPWIYDASRNAYSYAPENSYLDNLALADRTLGEVRRALEGTSKWDSSIVLVSSDHWWRTAEMVNGKRDHRIPFMLKLAGQKAGMVYDKPFNTILTRELLLQLLRGSLTSPSDVAAWIDNNSKQGESPITAVQP